MGGASLAPMNDLDKRLERAALDLNVYSYNPAKWIVDMAWLNLVEQTKFSPFSKAGEGDIDIS